jgi:replicative superfamily II helicase
MSVEGDHLEKRSVSRASEKSNMDNIQKTIVYPGIKQLTLDIKLKKKSYSEMHSGFRAKERLNYSKRLSKFSKMSSKMSTGKNSAQKQISENSKESLGIDDSMDQIYLEDLSDEVLNKFKCIEKDMMSIHENLENHEIKLNSIAEEVEKSLDKTLQVI